LQSCIDRWRKENGQVLIESIEASLQVNGERELLMQLFANLIENALRHTPRGSTIGVAARRIERGVQVSVTDNGHGIPENLRGKGATALFSLWNRVAPRSAAAWD